MRMVLALALQIGTAAVAMGQEQSALQPLGYTKTWVEPTRPQHIVGPIYYVGTRELAAYLVTTPAGHVLIGGALPLSGPDIAASIRAAGFKPEDIRLLLINDALVDNAGTLSYFKQLSHARVAVMAGDAEQVSSGGRTDPLYGSEVSFQFTPVPVDRVLHDGDTVSVGGVSLLARLGAGFTRGATTWVTAVSDSGHKYVVAFPCCTMVSPAAKLVAKPTYPGISDDYLRTFAMLDSLRPDVWLTSRADAFDFERKREIAKTEGLDAWFDPNGYDHWLATEKGKYAARVSGEMQAQAGGTLASRSLSAPGTLAAPDPFYDPPDSVPPHPGQLIRSELLKDRILPAGTRAWRILYTTTLNDSTPAVASATVLAPAGASSIPRPVISWAHGSLGIVPKCAPSLRKNPIDDVPGLDEVVSHGWVLVAPDYTGLGTVAANPYFIGQGEARSALDAVRAARQMKGLLLDPRTVVWGHSQGAHAALWEGIIAPHYAANANVIGVIADSPPTDMPALLTVHRGDPVEASIGSFLATAYANYYPDIAFDSIVRPAARDASHRLAQLCFDDDGMRAAEPLLVQLSGAPLLANPDSDGLAVRLRENEPQGLITVPLLVVQGMADQMVSPEITSKWVQERCLAGQNLEYMMFTSLDHLSIDQPRSPVGPVVVRWTQDRLEGKPQKAECERKTIPR
jgi:alpha-beta hydrolase superfamily lysophospholipase